MASTNSKLRWIAACAVLVGGFEGLSTTAYHDKLANGLPTVCYGETKGVHMGDHYSKAQCLDMLAAQLPIYWGEIAPHITVPLSDNEKIAYTSFTYNLGAGAFIHSSFLQKLNAGRHIEACKGMLAYNRTRSMGVVKGLVLRRHKEDTVCETVDLEGPAQLIVPLKPHKNAPVPPVATPAPPKPAQAAPRCFSLFFWKLCIE
jgi:lysozyme